MKPARCFRDLASFRNRQKRLQQNRRYAVDIHNEILERVSWLSYSPSRVLGWASFPVGRFNRKLLWDSSDRLTFLVFEFSGCFLGPCPAASLEDSLVRSISSPIRSEARYRRLRASPPHKIRRSLHRHLRQTCQR